jgi:uncharacterized protein
MPEVESAYRAPWWARSGHVATIVGALGAGPAAAWSARERLELSDGDFVDLFWATPALSAKVAILSHGLEGSVEAPYIRGLTARLVLAGWHVMAWNYRGCGRVPNRLRRSYHSGESGDLRAVVAHVAPRYRDVALVGFSLGGNITLKYLGEAPPPQNVRAAVSISAPIDLASSARILDEDWGNRLYLWRFLRTLKAKTLAKLAAFPCDVTSADLARVQTIREFDELITAPWHGFAGADDYWHRASSLPHLAAVPVPTLLLSAQDDPLLAAPSYPRGLAEANHWLTMEAPTRGGHVAFPTRGGDSWVGRRVADFLRSR